VVTCRGVLEQTPVGPATALVEPPGSRIPSHRSEPGSSTGSLLQQADVDALMTVPVGGVPP
jgi:hypothetical protein